MVWRQGLGCLWVLKFVMIEFIIRGQSHGTRFKKNRIKYATRFFGTGSNKEKNALKRHAGLRWALTLTMKPCKSLKS